MGPLRMSQCSFQPDGSDGCDRLCLLRILRAAKQDISCITIGLAALGLNFKVL